MQQVALLQAAGALSASQGRVIWPTKGRLRDKLWDDWGTNRTVTVWQTMQLLSDKLTSRCVASYPCALVTSKTYSYATNRSLTSCRCVVSKPRTRWLRHKPNSHFVTNYAATIWQTNYSVCDKPTNTNRFWFWLGNVLRATAAWTFSSIIWPDGSAPVALASHKSLEKRRVAWLSYLFSHLHLLSSDSFSSLIFFLLLSSSLCLCPSLHFSSVHIVGSLTSKLPSKADCMTR